jgi:hypothetical protein
MSTVNQLTGGGFQDILGNVLAYGTMLMQLNVDANLITPISTTISSNDSILILLDANGDVQTSPAQSVVPNDQLIPINLNGGRDGDTFYTVSVYSAEGQLVWGPNAQQVLSTPSPFDIGTWIPGTVAVS